ncbi:MAG TPA: sulfurylase small subunit [Gemmatimonadetes bacterium]|nr:sulfurylase small subunit [Gemmatimonadota bacterium]HBD97959.1 sulfurylase small subunit [Gemmatimonadota bacterium]HIC54213.1 XdhC family protein [Gemmatimonadota bacterium]HIN49935.1 XdhC family protein [Gemmatimonadota bacterium]|tara:strand:- start:488 stop:829 length:342 start_codon:yes stop_codon:yes gene_type:complete
MTHDDDKSLTEALQAAREAGRCCALATIVGTKGSTPRKVGARMIVDPEVGLVGTVGGGCGEAEVIEAAKEVLKTGVPRRVRVDLTDDFVSWSPAVCGGIMDIFLEAVDGHSPG